MTRVRWLGLAVAAAGAATAISFGATGLAATHAAHTNYQGGSRGAPAVRVAHETNYRGPARRSGGSAAVHGSNVPSNLQKQREQAR